MPVTVTLARSEYPSIIDFLIKVLPSELNVYDEFKDVHTRVIVTTTKRQDDNRLEEDNKDILEGQVAVIEDVARSVDVTIDITDPKYHHFFVELAHDYEKQYATIVHPININIKCTYSELDISPK